MEMHFPCNPEYLRTVCPAASDSASSARAEGLPFLISVQRLVSVQRLELSASFFFADSRDRTVISNSSKSSLVQPRRYLTHAAASGISAHALGPNSTNFSSAAASKPPALGAEGFDSTTSFWFIV